MRQIFMFVLYTLINTPIFGESLVSLDITPENNTTRLNTRQKISTIQKKLSAENISFKERLLWRWIEKKFTKKENSKNSVNKTGFASLVFSIIAVISIAILLITDKEALLGLLVVAIIAGLLALIFAAISLIKRSKLKDRTKAKAWPAFTGIIFSILTAILIAILTRNG